MNISPQHINQFLKKSKDANFAGVFYSTPAQSEFEFLLQDLNQVSTESADEFIFHPFDQQFVPRVVLNPQYRNEHAVEILHGLIGDSSYWVLQQLLKEENTTVENYHAQFGKYTSAIQEGICEKAILSTITKTNILENYNIGEFIFRLRKEYPQSYIYLLSSPITGTWIGATPETFLKWSEDEISTMSLAGTKKQGAGNFIFGEKEKREQEIVTQYIEAIFKESLTNVQMENPVEFNYGEMVHLITRISAKTSDYFSKNDFLKLSNQFHPTPAVGGAPKKAAKELISSTELHSRSYYSGYLGTISKDSAELAVNLRCMALSNDCFYVFAGGGITRDSNVNAEWAETRLKAQALLKFL